MKSKRPDGRKWCNKGKHFVSIKGFSKSASNNSGLEPYCKTCRSFERVKNAEKINNQRKVYYKNNPQKLIEKSRRHYIKTAEKQCEKSRRYYAENKEKIQKRRSIYYAENREMFSAARHRRRARAIHAQGNFTKEQWFTKLKFFGNRCYLCGVSLENLQTHLEHRIPISRGGSNWISNIAPACKKCNLTKNNKTEKEFRKNKIENDCRIEV